MREKTKEKFDAVEALRAEGLSVEEACKKTGLAVSYYHSLRKRSNQEKKKYTKIIAEPLPVSSPAGDFVFVVPMSRVRDFLGAFQ